MFLTRLSYFYPYEKNARRQILLRLYLNRGRANDPHERTFKPLLLGKMEIRLKRLAP